MGIYKTIITILIIMFCSSSLLHAFESNDGISLSLNNKLGKVSGYIQIPSGGEKGTTSDRRPTLLELGIDNIKTFEAAFWYNKNQHGLGLILHPIRFTGSTILNQDLIFHNLDYLKGSKVEYDIKLDWYEIGYSYKYSLSKNFNISPTIRGVIWDFKTELTVDNISDDRNFNSGGCRIGLIGDWNINKWFSISVEGIIPLPFNVQIYTFNINGNVNILKKKDYQLSIYSGISYEKMYFKDGQDDEQNNIDINFGPIWYYGLTISF